MAKPTEKLAEALTKMQAVQIEGIVRSSQLTRTYLTRLVRTGCLEEIMRGWFFVVNPTLPAGETVWYTFYWSFLRLYLAERFGEDYCLLPEPSLRLLTGDTVVPTQLAVMHPTPGQQVVQLPLGTSLFVYQESKNFPQRVVTVEGLRVMDLSTALVRVSEGFFRDRPQEAQIALRLVRDPTLLLTDLLENGRSVVAGRLVGAFRHVGAEETADRILKAMRSVGYEVRETDPFKGASALSSLSSSSRSLSPYVPRLQAMWAQMREEVISMFPPSPGLPEDIQGYLDRIEEKSVQDAYHSLSIEGYRVTPELIEKIRQGNWNPQNEPEDRNSRDALAARGYLEAFREVKASVARILEGEKSAEGVRKTHHGWHSALFAPSVGAGLLSPAGLAGYRQGPVYIRGSRHIPVPAHALPDAMEAFFELLGGEENAAVRAVLGHFAFVFLRPYSDGNGRTARFLMNAMFASGGYPWTIIHLENRTRYMEALEAASVDKDIRPFTACVLKEMETKG